MASAAHLRPHPTVAPSSPAPAVLTFGTAVSDITPQEPLPLWGFGARKRGHRAGSTRSPLLAKALVLRDGASVAVAIVALDLGRTPPDATVAAVRQEATRRLGLSEVILIATHTHCAPDMRARSAAAYVEWLRAELVALIERAVADCTAPCRLEVGECTADVGFERLALQADGSVRMQWDSPDRRPTQPVDQTVTMVHVRPTDDAGRQQRRFGALLLCLAVHPVIFGADILAYSSDLAGAVCRRLQQRTGELCLWVQGAAGNINPYRAQCSDDGVLASEAEVVCAAVTKALLRASDGRGGGGSGAGGSGGGGGSGGAGGGSAFEPIVGAAPIRTASRTVDLSYRFADRAMWGIPGLDRLNARELPEGGVAAEVSVVCFGDALAIASFPGERGPQLLLNSSAACAHGSGRGCSDGLGVRVVTVRIGPTTHAQASSGTSSRCPCGGAALRVGRARRGPAPQAGRRVLPG